MSEKPRILLIPDLAWWVIGDMGKQIMARFGGKYDFYFVPERLFERRPELLQSMIPGLHAIHCLNETAILLFRGMDRATLPPIATWIHHVTSWSPHHQMAADWSSALTACTREWKETLDQRVRGRIPVTVVPHGIDIRFFSRRKVNLKRFGIPPNRFVLGFIASKNSDADGGRKGTDVLLDVIRNAAALVPNLHVVLGGVGWESELASLTANGISASAPGYVRKEDLPLLYSTFDVFLLTSRVEGGPCTVFEAMSCETAVVSTRVGAVPELIVDGVNGFSTEIDDRQALLSAIVRLSQSPEMRLAVAKRARETLAARSWETALTPLEDVYDSLVGQRSIMGEPQQGPPWMKDPEGFLRTTCAADALGMVVPRVRKGSISAVKGFRQLREMLDKESLIDITRGAAMLRGVRFKTNPRLGYPGASSETTDGSHASRQSQS